MHAITLEEIKNYLINSDSVLDIGVGSGFMTLAFALL